MSSFTAPIPTLPTYPSLPSRIRSDLLAGLAPATRATYGRYFQEWVQFSEEMGFGMEVGVEELLTFIDFMYYERGWKPQSI